MGPHRFAEGKDFHDFKIFLPDRPGGTPAGRALKSLIVFCVISLPLFMGANGGGWVAYLRWVAGILLASILVYSFRWRTRRKSDPDTGRPGVRDNDMTPRARVMVFVDAVAAALLGVLLGPELFELFRWMASILNSILKYFLSFHLTAPARLQWAGPDMAFAMSLLGALAQVQLKPNRHSRRTLGAA